VRMRECVSGSEQEQQTKSESEQAAAGARQERESLTERGSEGQKERERERESARARVRERESERQRERKRERERERERERKTYTRTLDSCQSEEYPCAHTPSHACSHRHARTYIHAHTRSVPKRRVPVHIHTSSPSAQNRNCLSVSMSLFLAPPSCAPLLPTASPKMPRARFHEAHTGSNAVTDVQLHSERDSSSLTHTCKHKHRFSLSCSFSCSFCLVFFLSPQAYSEETHTGSNARKACGLGLKI